MRPSKVSEYVCFWLLEELELLDSVNTIQTAPWAKLSGTYSSTSSPTVYLALNTLIALKTRPVSCLQL